MDELDIYVSVEELSGDHIKSKGEISSSEIYQNEDTRHAVEPSEIGPPLSGNLHMQRSINVTVHTV